MTTAAETLDREPGADSRTVAVHFIRALVSAVEQRGVDVAAVLERAGIPHGLLEFDRARLTIGQACAVVRKLWQVTGDDLFGLGAHPLPLGSLRLVTLGLIQLRDLGSVLARFCEFSRVLPGLPSARLRTAEAVSRLELAPARSAADQLATEVVLFSLCRFAGWLTGTTVRVDRVELPHPEPLRPIEYDLVFGCPLRFDAASAALLFDTGLLAEPVVRTEAELLAYLRRSPYGLLTGRDGDPGIAGEVRKLLERGLCEGWPTSEEVAARLSFSLQHVRRLLRDEGTSISQLKENILRDAAIASLVRGDEPISALSQRLGFSEPSAFRRAFRRWTGSSPGSYRRVHELSLAGRADRPGW